MGSHFERRPNSLEMVNVCVYVMGCKCLFQKHLIIAHTFAEAFHKNGCEQRHKCSIIIRFSIHTSGNWACPVSIVSKRMGFEFSFIFSTFNGIIKVIQLCAYFGTIYNKFRPILLSHSRLNSINRSPAPTIHDNKLVNGITKRYTNDIFAGPKCQWTCFHAFESIRNVFCMRVHDRQFTDEAWFNIIRVRCMANANANASANNKQ